MGLINRKLALSMLYYLNVVVRTGLLGLVIIVLHACSISIKHMDGPPTESVDVSMVPDAVPRDEPKSRYGNPVFYVVNGNKYYVKTSSKGFVQRGIASWYGRKFHGHRTSSGETFDMYAMTAAHKALPLPTYVEVRNVKNGKRIIVRINDRGPFHENRIIDLSYTAAVKLDIVREGTGLVELRAIDAGDDQHNIAMVQSGDNGGMTGFYIQVGSFSSYANAIKLKDKLGGLADSLIHISKAMIKEEALYRVRFGPIQDIDVADRIVANLDRYGINEHHFVVDL